MNGISIPMEQHSPHILGSLFLENFSYLAWVVLFLAHN